MLDFSVLPDVSAIHPELKEPSELEYAAHMKAREDALDFVFGTPHPNGDILVPSDPGLLINWPGGGIYQYPASDRLGSWHYVTSGLAQPLADVDQAGVPEQEKFSGFGCELVISTPSEVAWAPDVLLNLVRYLLFDENARPIFAGDRIPCGGPLVLDTRTKLNHLVARLSSDYETQLKLPAGRCELVHLAGVTQAEIDAAKAEGPGALGSMVLCAVMDSLGIGAVSDPDRECLTAQADFQAFWRRARESIDAGTV